MSIFKHQVTSPEGDRLVMITYAFVGLLIASVPPYGKRAVFFGLLAAVNAFNGWRLHRKTLAARLKGSGDS